MASWKGRVRTKPIRLLEARPEMKMSAFGLTARMRLLTVVPARSHDVASSPSQLGSLRRAGKRKAVSGH